MILREMEVDISADWTWTGNGGSGFLLEIKNLADGHPLASEDRPEPRENGATVIWMSMKVIHVDWRFDAVKIHATKQKWPS